METRLPEKPGLSSDGESWSESEGPSSNFLRAQRGKFCFECCRAKLVRRKGLPFFVEDEELGIVALSCHVALNTLYQGNA